jgi:hypothetical protein
MADCYIYPWDRASAESALADAAADRGYVEEWGPQCYMWLASALARIDELEAELKRADLEARRIAPNSR